MQPAILPDRNISLENSLLGIGAVLIENLDKPKSVSQLWRDCPLQTNYDVFILALDFLYIIGAVEIEQGLLFCPKKITPFT